MGILILRARHFVASVQSEAPPEGTSGLAHFARELEVVYAAEVAKATMLGQARCKALGAICERLNCADAPPAWLLAFYLHGTLVGRLLMTPQGGRHEGDETQTANDEGLELSVLLALRSMVAPGD